MLSELFYIFLHELTYLRDYCLKEVCQKVFSPFFFGLCIYSHNSKLFIVLGHSTKLCGTSKSDITIFLYEFTKRRKRYNRNNTRCYTLLRIYIYEVPRNNFIL